MPRGRSTLLDKNGKKTVEARSSLFLQCVAECNSYRFFRSGKNGPPQGQDAREEKGSAEKHLSGAAKETQVGISKEEGRQEVSKGLTNSLLVFCEYSFVQLLLCQQNNSDICRALLYLY
jgi:hypothetical protein